MKKFTFLQTVGILLFTLFFNSKAYAQPCSVILSSTDSLICSGDNITLNALVNGEELQLMASNTAGNNHRGNMFDIVATNAVTILSFDASPMGNTTIAIYYKAGTWNGFANTPSAWTLIGSAPVAYTGGFSPVAVDVNVTIPAGETYAFYVTTNETGGVALNYSNGTNVGNVYSSDANITFLEGGGMEFPFTQGTGAVYQPRVWNGMIHYTLADQPGTVFTWGNGDPATSIAEAPTMTTQYTASASIPGCPTTLHDTLDIVVSIPPVNAGVDIGVCLGDSVTLSGLGAETYAWDNSITDNQAFLPLTSSDYIVTGTDSIGCVVTDTVFVDVFALPVVSAGTDQIVCDGSPITLSGTGADTYSWNNGITDNVEFTPVSSTDYIVTGTDANGCISQDTVAIDVVALPVVSAGADQTVCEESSITLSGSGAETYIWDNSVTDNQSFVVLSAAEYIVTGTDANGCIGVDTVFIDMYNLPTVSAGTDQIVCEESSITLSGSGAETYIWNNAVIDNQAFVVLSAAEYIVVGTDANGCVDIDTVFIDTYTLPTVSAGVDQVVCEGTAVTLSGSGTDTYSWNNGITDNIAFTPLTSMDYIVTGTDGNGCSKNDTVTVTVNPTPNVSAGPDVDFCKGEEHTLSGTGADTYVWDNGVTNGVSFTPAATGIYTVVGTDTNGCVATDEVRLTMHTIMASIFSSGSTLSAGTLVDMTAQWIDCSNMSLIPNETDVVFEPQHGGSYAVIIEDNAYGCADTSNCVQIEFVGIDENTMESLDIYPNPTAGDVKVTFEGTSATLTIRDAAGKLVWSNEIQQNATISLNDYQKGIYFFELKTETQTGIKRIVKQ